MAPRDDSKDAKKVEASKPKDTGLLSLSEFLKETEGEGVSLNEFLKETQEEEKNGADGANNNSTPSKDGAGKSDGGNKGDGAK